MYNQLYTFLPMKTNDSAVCLLAGRGTDSTRDLCRLLTDGGVTALVKQKENALPDSASNHPQWSGTPGQDLFFNGWKLLF